MPAFPIDPYIKDILIALQKPAPVLLKAEPGAGKTTRVPQALLSQFKRILVVQPRRLAAKLSAEWVAAQCQSSCGQLVGYQIRLENRSSPITRLLYVTEGVLTRKLLQDPLLNDFDLVILDEFHERHIHTDIALALLLRIQRQRKDLRLLIMSATLDSAALELYLETSQVFNIPGRIFPVAVEYRPGGSQSSLEVQVTAAVFEILEDTRCGGNVLVFLSGIGEILGCAEYLKSRLKPGSAELIPLSAELADNYKLLLQNPEIPKIVLSTNVAETSVTLPGIRGVIDSGWARISGYAPWSGLPTLETQRISQASCIQRTGRAGRIASGLCLRLFSAADFYSRPKFTEPEIKRIDLCQILLELQVILPGQTPAWESLAWLEAPDEAILRQNIGLLQNLGALDAEARLTEAGRKMAAWPLHPRLARIILEGQRRETTEGALLAALLIGEGMLLKQDEKARDHLSCDVCFQVELLLAYWRRSSEAQRRISDGAKAQRLRQVYDSLRASCGAKAWNEIEILDFDKIRRCIFAGFADRVARHRPLASEVRGRRQRHFNFCLGRGAVLSEASVVREHEWLVAIDAREILSEEAESQRGRIFVASAIEPAWLEEDPFHLLEKTLDIHLDEKTGRARRVSRQAYGRLLIEEVFEQLDGAAMSHIIFETVSTRWPEPFKDMQALVVYHNKLDLLDRYGVEHKLPRFKDEFLQLLIAHICEGAQSLADIARQDLRQKIEEQLDYIDLKQLQEQCPDQIQLNNGKRMDIHYEDTGDPWLAGRIQDFFGQADTPTICKARQKLLIKLLAPNYRPAQITQDLAGFWRGSYHEVKKELKRRYPKHSWPEDPAQAKPDERRPRPSR